MCFKCPRCKSKNIKTERRINGKQWCLDCDYILRDGLNRKLPPVNVDTPMPKK